MDNLKIWIWLSLALGYDNSKVKRLYRYYDDISEFYKGKEFEWRMCGLFNIKDIEKLCSTPMEKAEKIIQRCSELNIKMYSIDDDLYPQRLRDIGTPPAVIYVSGHLPAIDDLLAIGIVGTRKATGYGKKTAYKIAHNLCKCKVIVISGGALGIDCTAHNGALNADGITICVLGCGINYPYLKNLSQMRRAITQRGCLISEYPPDTEPLGYFFPQRNRIISALSNGVLVIEAAERSGALITANLAAEQGKEVFAVPGNIDSVYSLGANRLIKDGAVPVSSHIDIIEFYNNRYDLEICENDTIKDEDKKIAVIPSKASKKSSAAVESEVNIEITGHRFDVELDDNSYKVYHIIGVEPMSLDDIATKSGVPSFEVSDILEYLEAEKLITSLSGHRYKLS